MEQAELAELLPAEIPGLLRYATSMVRDQQLAEDLVGDTCVRALERAASFRRDAALATWLHRILHNLAVDRARAQREVPAEDVEAEVELRWQDNDYTVDAAVVVARAETAAELHDALIRLPYSHRAVVVLHDAHGMTAAEAAAVCGISVPAAKQRLRRGRMMLVTALAEGVERRRAVRGVPLSCWEARRRVSDFLDHDVDEATAVMLQTHLASCPTCPALYASLVAATDALAAGEDAARRRDPDSTIPPGIEQRLRAAASRPDRH